jgi:hypothetical protein
VTIWIVNSIISGKRYVERYINEELHGRTKEQDHSTQG